jgi:hypothetical protein
MLSAVILNATFGDSHLCRESQISLYSECHFVLCRYADCRYADCRYADCCYADCRYADCRYADCRGAISLTLMNTNVITVTHFFTHRRRQKAVGASVPFWSRLFVQGILSQGDHGSVPLTSLC